MLWRKSANLALLVLYFAGLAVLAFYVGGATQPAHPANQKTVPTRTQLDCGHWAVFRACELLGIPVDPKSLVAMMPHAPEGHSMKQIADALKAFGLEAQGKKESYEHFLAGAGVRIVHLSVPNHFIVVLRADANQVSFFDDHGRHRTLPPAVLQQRWSGNVLAVKKSSVVAGAGSHERQEETPAPRIAFDTLFIDQGDIPVVGPSQTVIYSYPFRNDGKNDLVIKKVHTTCACLSSKPPEQAIPPGATGAIRLEYAVDGRHRAFVHEALVETNDPVHPMIVLRAAGNANTQVHVTPDRVQFGQVPWGQTKKLHLIVRYEGDQSFQVEAVQCDHPALKASIKPANDPALRNQLWPHSQGQLRMLGSMGLLELECQAEAGLAGELSGTLTIQTNIAHFQKMTVPVKAKIVTPVMAYPGLIALTAVAEPEPIETTLTLASLVDQPFQVKSLSPQNLRLTWTSEPGASPKFSQKITILGSRQAFLEMSGKALSLTIESAGDTFELLVPVHVFRTQSP